MRKQKLTSIMITSLLILSTIAFITIPIASATPAQYFFETQEATDPTDALAVAEWTTDEQKFGDWSAHLLATDFGTGIDAARVVIPVIDFDVNIDFDDITSVSYWFKYTCESGYAFPYLIFAIDTIHMEAPYTADTWVVLESGGEPGYTPTENTWLKWDLTVWNKFKVMPAGTTIDTLANVQTAIDGIVLAVKVAVGETAEEYMPMEAYVDDITINGVTYPLEPEEEKPVGGTFGPVNRVYLALVLAALLVAQNALAGLAISMLIAGICIVVVVYQRRKK